MSRSEAGATSGRHVKRKHGLTRTKTGCLTCRKRRKKCDGSIPQCSHCSRLDLSCTWPEADDLAGKAVRVRTGRDKRYLSLDHPSDGDVDTPDKTVAPVYHRPKTFAYTESPLQPTHRGQETSHSRSVNTSPASLTTRDYTGFTKWSSMPGSSTSPDRASSSMGTSTLYRSVCSVPALSGTKSSAGDSISGSPDDEKHTIAFDASVLVEPMDHDTRILLDYFETEFAHLISVAPAAHNDFLHVFMPMSRHCVGVRDALAGWSATHLRDIDDKFEAQSRLYMNRAIIYLNAALDGPDQRDLDTTLALALIICAVEVCKDSDSEWVRYRQIAHTIIKRRDLVHSYCGRDQIFLLKNFAYHDVLSSFVPDEDSSLNTETHKILSTMSNSGGPNCYMGVAMPIYSLISETTTLATRLRREKWDQRRIATHACRLIVMLDNTEPSESEMKELPTTQVVAQHLTIFKILQSTAKLYIHQVLLRYNSSSIGSQILIQGIMPLFNTLQTVLVEMLFPLFIVGVDSLHHDRHKIKRMLEIMDERFRIGNVRCAYTVLEKCWETNSSGDEYVDWNAVAYSIFDQCITLA